MLRQQCKVNFLNGDTCLKRSLPRLSSLFSKWNAEITHGVSTHGSCRTKTDLLNLRFSSFSFSWVLMLIQYPLYFSGLSLVHIHSNNWPGKKIRKVLYQLALVEQSFYHLLKKTWRSQIWLRIPGLGLSYPSRLKLPNIIGQQINKGKSRVRWQVCERLYLENTEWNY